MSKNTKKSTEIKTVSATMGIVGGAIGGVATSIVETPNGIGGTTNETSENSENTSYPVEILSDNDFENPIANVTIDTQLAPEPFMAEMYHENDPIYEPATDLTINEISIEFL